MLPKRSRLSAREVRAILKTGRSVRLPTVSAKYQSGPTKAAVVVSSKVAKNATTRNSIRRRAYAALKLPQGVQAVFFIMKADFAQDELITLCSRLS